MSDFTAKIKATLDTSDISKKLAEIEKNNKVKLSVDTSDITSKVQTALQK